MSPREQLQSELVEFLESKSDYFDAPYGIIDGLQPAGKGKVRVITFGVSRYLDATLSIWSLDRLTLRGQGALARSWEIEDGITFTSKEEFIDFINEKRPDNFGAKPEPPSLEVTLYDIVDMMDEFGGSFVKALSKAWRCADGWNRGLIETTWPSFFEEYQQMAVQRKQPQTPSKQ